MIVSDLQSAVSEMCGHCKRGEFVPIMEADVAGFLYHLLLVQKVCPARRIHLDTRVIGGRDSDRFDLVIGDVQRRQGDDRPAVSPVAIVEMKVFPIGFTPQQHRVHLRHILDDDLRKLGGVQRQDVTTVEFVFDAADYLSGIYEHARREEVIIGRRDAIARSSTILIAREFQSDWRVYTR